jgi:hypothetical protein
MLKLFFIFLLAAMGLQAIEAPLASPSCEIQHLDLAWMKQTDPRLTLFFIALSHDAYRII